MSMLSEQVNKLRMLAGKLRNVHARRGDDFVESCETLYWSMCAMLEAADTILSLRNRLQDAELGETCEQEERGWSTEGDHARVWLTCGHDCMVPTVADLPKFCPECGRKVTTNDD